MGSASVRYIVDDVEAAIPFYTDRLGFEVEMHPGPGFARLVRGDLRLLLNGSLRSRGRGPADARRARARAGGWNRIQLEVDDLASEVDALRAAGATFRNEIIIGRGGKQILLDDPSGNPIELFEPRRGDR